MRYRRLDRDGDWQMGHGTTDYLIDSPECVAQAVRTRLMLLTGEWFLDLAEGTPYATHVFGKHVAATYDPILRRRILQTEGVNEILFYESLFEPETRTLAVSVELDTVYGPAAVNVTL